MQFDDDKPFMPSDLRGTREVPEEDRITESIPDPDVCLTSRSVAELLTHCPGDFELICCVCKKKMSPGADYYADACGESRCEDCIQPSIAAFENDAAAFAEEHGKVYDLPEFDREKQTPRQYFAKCRHENTNYEYLLNLIPNHDMTARDIAYGAIRRKINALLETAICSKYDSATADWIIENRHLEIPDYVKRSREAGYQDW